jgi:hypothetical protein
MNDILKILRFVLVGVLGESVRVTLFMAMQWDGTLTDLHLVLQ